MENIGDFDFEDDDFLDEDFSVFDPLPNNTLTDQRNRDISNPHSPESNSLDYLDQTVVDFSVAMDTPEFGLRLPSSATLDVPLQRRPLSQVTATSEILLQRRTPSQITARRYPLRVTRRQRPEFEPRNPAVRRHSETDFVESRRQISSDEQMARYLQAQFDLELDEPRRRPETASALEPLHEGITLRPGTSNALELIGEMEAQMRHIRNISSSSSGSDTVEEPMPGRNNRIPEVRSARISAGGRFTRAAENARNDYRRNRYVRSRRANSQSSTDEYERLWDLSERIGDVISRGLKETQISRFPIRKVVKDGTGASSSSIASQNAANDDKDCHVCLSEFQINDSLRILPCFHEYHVECIDKWLKDNNTCPVCRVRVDECIDA